MQAKMTSLERRGLISLSSIMSLRMIGLFMVLPVFSLYATHLENATPFLIGVALGIYGLGQALCQIPFGVLSDRFGRKPIIFLGLIIFAMGSLIASLAHSIEWMIVGRALQGIGAIGSTILAFIADLTREEQRTKAMAISGMTIGLSFAIAMFMGPVLTQWMSVNQLFLLAVLFSFIAIFILFFAVPLPVKESWHRDTEPELTSFFKLLITPELAKLNSGIFILHAIFTASFIVIPISLQQLGFATNRQWLLYLPTLFVGFLFSIFCIGLAEKKQQIKSYFVAGIMMLALAEGMLWISDTHLFYTLCGLSLFFWGFSLLESFMPSLISRTAPAARKGSALGIYSCAQYLGIFIGGIMGGWLFGQFSYVGVYLFCVILALFWLIIAFFMRPPRYLVTRLWRLTPNHHPDWHHIASVLQRIPGMIEITYIAEESVAYLKMERSVITHPDFIRLQEQLQSE